MTSPIPFQSVQDGPRVTVNDLLKYPTLVPDRVLSMAAQGFIADALLRSAGAPQGGAMLYREATSLYADNANGDFVVEEFGEIPVANGQLGPSKVAHVFTRGLSVLISEDMRNRNQIDAVNLAIRQVTNTMLAKWDDVTLSLIDDAATVVDDPSVHWSVGGDTPTPLEDIGTLVTAINTATDDAGEQYNYNADTLVMNPQEVTRLMYNKELRQLFVGNAAADNPLFKGQLSANLLGLTIMSSPRVTAGTVYALNRGVVGGIGDERPLRATNVYMWRPEAETWRSDVTRKSAMFIDQPKAAAKFRVEA